MKSSILYFAGFLAFALLSAASSPPPAHATNADQQVSEREIVTAESNWMRALSSGDTRLLRSVVSENFVMIVPPTGRLSRERLLATETGVPRAFTGEANISDRHFQVFGEVVLLSDTFKTVGNGRASQALSDTFWQTEAWHREANGWKLVQVHISPTTSLND